VERGEVRMSTFAEALEQVPSGGLAYLPTASYREMEAWSLPTEAALRLERLERDMTTARAQGPDGALVRGAHWRNFQVKYAESNRLHKKMLALSTLCRERGDPPTVRRAIARAQCNDAYWHGVFGGLYLPHLRDALWAQLAIAEGALRVGEPLTIDIVDIDCDGHDELWVHGEHVSVIISPHRGGAVEEYTLLAARVNYANTLTRRRESYHKLADAPVPGAHAKGKDAAPSIHDIEQGLRVSELPPADLGDRSLLAERVLPAGLTRAAYARAEYVPLRSWAAVPMHRSIEGGDTWVELVLTPQHVPADAPGPGKPSFEKRLRVHHDGRMEARYEWDAAAYPADAYFAPELSVTRPEGAELVVTYEPAPTAVWEYAIETVSKSEQGLDHTVQGFALTPLWPASLGHAHIQITPAAPAAVPDQP
jgi:alpha-amylase